MEFYVIIASFLSRPLFLQGADSAFRPVHYFVRKANESIESDVEALRGDWVRIGNDYREAVKQAEGLGTTRDNLTLQAR